MRQDVLIYFEEPSVIGEFWYPFFQLVCKADLRRITLGNILPSRDLVLRKLPKFSGAFCFRFSARFHSQILFGLWSILLAVLSGLKLYRQHDTPLLNRNLGTANVLLLFISIFINNDINALLSSPHVQWSWRIDLGLLHSARKRCIKRRSLFSHTFIISFHVTMQSMHNFFWWLCKIRFVILLLLYMRNTLEFCRRNALKF